MTYLFAKCGILSLHDRIQNLSEMMDSDPYIINTDPATLNCEPRKVSFPAKNRGESESATKEDVREVWGERNQFPRNLWPGVSSKARG